VLAVVLGGTPTPTRPAPCPAQGDATKAEIRALNEQKTRNDTPAEDDVDETVTIDGLVEPGDDSQRWQDGAAVEVVAYVVDVRDGGATSANCHSADPADHDTILEISPDADVFDRAHRAWAAVTPARRRLMAKIGEDWSTRSLRAQFLHRYVSVTGWLLFDAETAGKALNTAEDAGPSIARATAWEIHPVTGLELAEEGGAETAFFDRRRGGARPRPLTTRHPPRQFLHEGAATGAAPTTIR
jgi:hypothetical protein